METLGNDIPLQDNTKVCEVYLHMYIYLFFSILFYAYNMIATTHPLASPGREVSEAIRNQFSQHRLGQIVWLFFCGCPFWGWFEFLDFSYFLGLDQLCGEQKCGYFLSAIHSGSESMRNVKEQHLSPLILTHTHILTVAHMCSKGCSFLGGCFFPYS